MTCGPDRKLIFLDSETCGLHSMMVLLQWAEGPDGDIKLWEIWKNPVRETLDILEWMAENVMVGFNLAFDHFHIQKIHAIWSRLPEDWIPADHIAEIAAIEKDARECDCLKPYSALDLMLHSRKGPWQSLMARKDIRIKRIPTTPVEWKGCMIPLAYALANHLEETVELDGIYFARTADPDAPRWTVMDRVKDGIVDRDFADVCLKFHPDGGLKSLAEHALKMPPKYAHSDIAIAKKYLPVEVGYAPFAEAVSSADKNWEVWEYDKNKDAMKLKGYAWPALIQHHIDHWHTNTEAREYAYDDIVYTRGLYYHFEEPAHGDRDSILSCMVPSVRWRGFEVDLQGIKELRVEAQEVAKQSPINTNKPSEIRQYIHEFCDENEQLHLDETTDKAKLQEMSEWVIAEREDCMACLAGLEPDCTRCGGKGYLEEGVHPAAGRAKEILNIKISKKEIELYDKLIQAGSFHPSFKITGTLSNRMAGGDGLNAQGITKKGASGSSVRRHFNLKWPGYVLCGGDFDSFEVSIADAVYNDPDLRIALCQDRKVHALFGTCLFPKYSYDEIIDSEKNPHLYGGVDMYTKAKSGVFAMIYGGNADTLHRNLGVDKETAEAAYKSWCQMFPGIARARQRVIDAHQALMQPGGIGTQIEWNEPHEYVESFLGFRRYFTLEYKIVKSLFSLANNIPKEWRQCQVPVIRYEHRGVQKAWGALVSALYGAAFQIGEGIVRAAANHEIQSPGAEITKATQVAIWGLQPAGVHKFVVAPMNVHDEVISVTHPDYVEKQAEIVADTVESFRKYVPLIGIKWCRDMDNWAEKSGGDNADILHVTYDKKATLAEMGVGE